MDNACLMGQHMFLQSDQDILTPMTTMANYLWRTSDYVNYNDQHHQLVDAQLLHHHHHQQQQQQHLLLHQHHHHQLHPHSSPPPPLHPSSHSVANHQQQGVDPSVSEPFYPNMDMLKQDGIEMTDEQTNIIEQPQEITKLPTEQKSDGRKIRRKVSGTNLYGRPYCPGRPLSMEERTKIIELHMTGMKVNAISKTLCISHGCVSKIISRYRSTGILSPASSPEQRRRRKNLRMESIASTASSTTTTSSSPIITTPIQTEYKEYKPEYMPSEYTVHVHYMPSAEQDLTPQIPQHYALLPENILHMHDYHPILL